MRLLKNIAIEQSVARAIYFFSILNNHSLVDSTKMPSWNLPRRLDLNDRPKLFTIWSSGESGQGRCISKYTYEFGTITTIRERGSESRC